MIFMQLFLLTSPGLMVNITSSSASTAEIYITNKNGVNIVVDAVIYVTVSKNQPILQLVVFQEFFLLP